MEELQRRGNVIRKNVRAEFMPDDLRFLPKNQRKKNRRMVQPGASSWF